MPFTSFCEYADTKPRKTPTWFALNDDRPLAVFAGISTTWHGKRSTKANPVEGEHLLFGFLTTDANAEVGAIHPEAMPVILTTDAEIEQWMTAPAEQALARRALGPQILADAERLVTTWNARQESPSGGHYRPRFCKFATRAARNAARISLSQAAIA